MFQAEIIHCADPIGGPAPPRPTGHSPYSGPSPSAPNFPTASTSSASGTPGVSSGALGFALSAVDKVAGQDTRKQIEKSVGSLAHSEHRRLEVCLKCITHVFSWVR